MKKFLTLSTVIILTVILCACGGDDDTEGNIYDTYAESLIGFVADESGTPLEDLDDFNYGEYEKDGTYYTLIYSKTQTSKDKEVFYLVRTMEINEKFITDKISEDADLSEELTAENPYVATTMQNHAGDVFFYVVRVLDDSYQVLRDGEEANSPRENIYVETGDTEPVLEIVQKQKKSDNQEDS